MRAIHINAKERTITEVNLAPGYQNIYPFISDTCNMFECPYSYKNEDTIYVDEEGLYAGYDYGFVVKGISSIYVGNGLVVGTDENGASVDAKSDLETIMNSIIWVDKEVVLNYTSHFN